MGLDFPSKIVRRGTLTDSAKTHFKSTHKIDDISYKKDELVCICGWKGWAYDRPDNSDGKHWPTHRKTAPPINADPMEPYHGSFVRKLPKKKEMAA